MIPTHRAPTHPGEILLEEFLKLPHQYVILSVADFRPVEHVIVVLMAAQFGPQFLQLFHEFAHEGLL